MAVVVVGYSTIIIKLTKLRKLRLFKLMHFDKCMRNNEHFLKTEEKAYL